MSASAVVMATTGIFLTFAPEELQLWMNIPEETHMTIIFQILGALYFAFGMINWMSRGNLIGGIYSRPVAIGNVLHFVVVALALVKSDLWGEGQWYRMIFIGFYVLFAILFGVILFTHPIKDDSPA